MLSRKEMQIHMGKGIIHREEWTRSLPPCVCVFACAITSRCLSPTYCLREGRRGKARQEGSDREVWVGVQVYLLLPVPVDARWKHFALRVASDLSDSIASRSVLFTLGRQSYGVRIGGAWAPNLCFWTIFKSRLLQWDLDVDLGKSSRIKGKFPCFYKGWVQLRSWLLIVRCCLNISTLGH